MKITNLPSLRTEDFKGQEEWTPRLFTILNPFFQSLNQVLDKNVDYTDNIKSITKSYDVDYVQFQPFSFTWGFPTFIPVDLRVVKAVKATVPVILLAAWKYESGTSLITVTKMVELSEGGVSALYGRYQFTIRVTV